MLNSRTYRTAMAGAIFIALVNSWLAMHAIGTLMDAQRWQSHTLGVISQTEEMVAAVRTAESAARGYILTGAEPFEGQYLSSKSDIAARIAALRELTADNPKQQAQLTELSRRVAAKTAALEAGIEVRRAQPNGMLDPALMEPVVEDTPDRVASVQKTISSIEAEEKRLLNQRNADTAQARRQTWVTVVLAAVMNIVLLVVAFELLMRAQRSREQISADALAIGELNRDLQELNTELESRVEQRTRELQVSNQELEAFSYSVSHDLRAPLRTIDGFSLALQEDFADKLTDEGRDYIQRVRGGVQRMGGLIDALLQLSRVTRAEVAREEVNLSQVAESVCKELQASEPARKVEFVVQRDVTAEGDGRLLRVALENLIGNAWKFTSRNEQARIEFGSGERDGRPVYFIRDNGAGFDMQYVDRLFTAFQRLHGDRDFKGSGIGLATVSRIVRRHHGDIWAESELGRGATFYFTLGMQGMPAGQAEAITEAAEPRTGQANDE